jgi:hypothetical protein
MIVQYNVPTIIMITKTEERNPHNPSQPMVKFHFHLLRSKRIRIDCGRKIPEIVFGFF